MADRGREEFERAGHAVKRDAREWGGDLNQYEKRIQALERQRDERQKMPVVIAALTEAGEYLYKGVSYSKKAFDELMEKIKPGTIIIDDIPR